MLKLCIEDDEGQQTIVPIIRDEITIGRKDGNTIRLTERNVSRHHARLLRENGSIYVENVAARYGIKKNGEKITQREAFTEGDVVLIGDYRLTLKKEAPPATPGTADDSADEVKAESTNGFSSQPTQITRRPEDRPRPAASDGTEILPALPAKIVVVSSNFAGQEFPLARKEMVIGRGEECDIIIDHRSVSNKHAKITREGVNSYQIIDLNSKNGVRLNGEKYAHVALKRGDIIELGHVKFRFVEAGENYVFSPQSIDDDFESAPLSAPGSSDGLPKPLIFGGIFLVVLIVGGFLLSNLMGPGDNKKDNNTQNNNKTVTTKTKDPIDTIDPKDAKNSKKIDQVIAKAQKNFDQGNIAKAIGSLENLIELAEPSAEQRNRIDDLLAKAKPEKPFQKNFDAGKADLQNQDNLGALTHFKKIPKHSLFKTIIKDEGLWDKARLDLFEEIDSKYKDGKKETARNLASSYVELMPNDEEGKELLARVTKRASSPISSNNPKTTPKKTNNKTIAIKKNPTKKTPPKTTKMSLDEATTKYKAAMSDLTSGSADSAISKCKEVLRAKRRTADCHRVLGIAYKQKNNTKKACYHFVKANKIKPLGMLQKQIAKLQCE